MPEWSKPCCKLVDAHDNLLSSSQISKASSAYWGWCLKLIIKFGVSYTSNVHVQALHHNRNLC